MATVHAQALMMDVATGPALPVQPQPRSRRRSGELRPVDVDMEALEISARDASDVTASYLDTESGEVLVIVKGEPDERMLRDRVRGDRKRYKRVPPYALSDERALLRDFLSRETDGSGREL